VADRLGVFHDGRQVGELHRRPGGGLAFEYAGAWLEDGFPISASLPPAPGVNTDLAAHAFFANLLPEGRVREAVCRQLGLSVSNDFALLEAVGGECAGALSVLPVSADPSTEAGGYERLEPETVAGLARRFSVLAEVTGRHAPRLSLAGAQDKLPVRRDDDGTLWLPTGGAPSTHILKVPSRDFAHLPANEVLVTRLAREVGLVTAEVDLLELAGVPVALVRRYDRLVRGGGIVRLHQEDLCQALGLLPSTKYEEEGGPSFADALAVVRARSVEPLPDAQQLVRWLVFVLLVGNADGHGKNLSFVRGERGGVRLAPFYDLVSTRVYPGIDRGLAMGIGGERDPGQIGRPRWEALAAGVGIGRHLVLGEVERLAAALPGAFDVVAAGYAAAHGGSPVIQRLGRVVRRQCRRSRQLLGR